MPSARKLVTVSSAGRLVTDRKRGKTSYECQGREKMAGKHVSGCMWWVSSARKHVGDSKRWKVVLAN